TIDSRGLSVASPETTAWLSLVAYVRHTFTDYDELLAEGYDRDSARHFVAARMDKILQAWGVRRRLAPGDSLRRTNCINEHSEKLSKLDAAGTRECSAASR